MAEKKPLQEQRLLWYSLRRLLRLGRIQRAASAEHVVVVYGVDIGAVYLSLGELAFADVDD